MDRLDLDSYVILLEVTHVTDDSDPNKHGAGAEEDAAHIVACKDLREKCNS